ncbi:hypothetical protein BDV93DRAFT_529734 [Ceratobasidium sp. AG-I]|nr:hypothetical protein BDV93DRAFT_529734 [Ceratobasidium sp. AG-I]
MSSLFKSLNGFPTGHTPVPIFEPSNSGSNAAPPDDEGTTATAIGDGTNKHAYTESDKFDYFKADILKGHATKKYTSSRCFARLIRRVVKQNGAVTTDLHKLAHTRQSSPFGQAALLPATAAKFAQNSLITTTPSAHILEEEEEDWICVRKPRFNKNSAPM